MINPFLKETIKQTNKQTDKQSNKHILGTDSHNWMADISTLPLDCTDCMVYTINSDFRRRGGVFRIFFVKSLLVQN